MENRVYLIIDMQNDYCHPEGFYAKKDGSSHNMTEVADKIVNMYDEMVRVGHNIICFAIFYNELMQYENPCKLGSFGAEYYKINPEKLYWKNKFDCFSNKEFEKYLETNQITELVIMGFQLTMCVFETAKTALAKGYRTLLIKDLVGEREKHLCKSNDVYDYVIKHGGEVITSEMIL